MLQKNVIDDLITWLEKNLDESLSLESTAQKSGYTKWHFQRLFKLYTGYSLVKYIQARRLTRAAFEMRFTNITILDMALKSNFNSNQAFSRAFKYRFDISPYLYRHAESWNFKELCPPLNGVLPMHPVKSSVKILPDMKLIGLENIFFSSLDDYINNWGHVACNIWRKFQKQIISMPDEIYGVKKIRPYGAEGNLHYIVAVKPIIQFDDNRYLKNFSIHGGEYLCFEYKGPDYALHHYVSYLYESYMPLRGIIRRYGDDVEIFHHIQKNENISNLIICDYYIPIEKIT